MRKGDKRLLLPELDKLPSRGTAGILHVVDTTSDFATGAVCREVWGEGVVELAGEHATPVLGQVEVFGVHGEIWLGLFLEL